MVNPKRKGSAFELMIYRELRDLGDCKRTIGSGAQEEPGDILFRKGTRLFAIECKHLKKVSWAGLCHYWDKLNRQIVSYGRGEPAIIFRQNREPIMVMTLLKVEDKNVKGIVSYNVWKQLVRI